MNYIFSTIYPYRFSPGWKRALMESAFAAGYRCSNNKKYYLDSDITPHQSFRFVNGFEIERVVISSNDRGDQWGLGFVPVRLWFKPGEQDPTNTPEWKLGVNPPTKQFEKNIKAGHQLMKVLLGDHIEPIPGESHFGQVSDLNRKFNTGKKPIKEKGLFNEIKQFGFLDVPENFQPFIYHLDAKPSREVETIRTSVENFFEGKSVKVQSIETIEGNLQEKRKTIDALAKPNKPTAILFEVAGKKGEPLPAIVERVLTRMDTLGFRYRLFSRDNRPSDWSIHDQLGSLITAAGGKAFGLTDGAINQAKIDLFVGIDLSHPYDKNEPSVLAVSLVAADGTFIACWREQLSSRNERLQKEPVQRAMDWVNQATRRLGFSKARLLLLRDGRFFDRDDNQQSNKEQFIIDQLGPNNCTVVEYVKNAKCRLYGGDHQNPKKLPLGVMWRPLGGDPFILPVAADARTGASGPPIRLRVRHDGLSLGIELTSRLVSALSYAPGLGLKPNRLASPIMWADKVAAIGPTNHQASGQAIVYSRRFE